MGKMMFERVGALRSDFAPALKPATDWQWLIPVAVVTVVELLLWSVAYVSGAAAEPMLGAYGILTYVTFAVIVLVRLGYSLIRMAREGEHHPIRRLLDAVPPSRIVSTFVGLQLIAVGSAAFAGLKAGIPKAFPFWLDAPLANFEAWVFGAHPWQITHYLFGWATTGIDRIYATFVPTHILAVLILLSCRPSEVKTRAFVSLALAWLLIGIAGAYALSSAGPIFYDRAFGGDTFAQLTALIASDAPGTVRVADVLWLAHARDSAIPFNGISAVPSMHVALTLWLALVMRHSHFAPLFWVYYGIIWFGSVHLGWHYVADGLIGSAMMLAIWKAAPMLAYRPVEYRHRAAAQAQ